MASKFTNFYNLFPETEESTKLVLVKMYAIVLDLSFKCSEIEFYISIFGVILTIFHLIVLTRKPMRTSSIMSLMIATAICDLVSMGEGISVRDVISKMTPQKCTPPVTLSRYQVFNFLQPIRDNMIRCSTWLNVMMALIRLLALKFAAKPGRLHNISTFPFGFKVFGITLTISSIFSFFHYLRGSVVPVGEWTPSSDCLLSESSYSVQTVYEVHVSELFLAHDELLLRIYMLINGTASRVLPCILFPLLTILLILELEKTRKVRKASNHSDCKCSSERTTGLVVFMSVSFFIALLPSGIAKSFQVFYTDIGFLYMSTYIDQICFAVFSFNSSLHCFICFAMSSQYRMTVSALLRIPKRRVVRKKSQVTTVTDGTTITA